MRDVEITKEPVQLYKILKLEGLAANGGAAKAAVAEGLVRVNGQLETRKRKQIVDGDIVEFMGQKLRVRLVHATPDPTTPKQA